MNSKNKTQNLFSLKFISFSLVTTLFLISCEKIPNKNMSINEKFIDIYKKDIKMKLADLKEITANNELKYKNSYTETLSIQSKFDSIYSLIEDDNFDIKPLLEEISEQTNKHYRFKTAKKLECILNMNITEIGKKELQSVLLELNSAIITEFHYDVDLTDYRFNKICAYVIPEKREVKQGETYRAYVVIAGVDSTALPNITINDQTIQMKSTNGLIQIKGEKRGLNQATASVNMKSTDGFTRQYKFQLEFNVK